MKVWMRMGDNDEYNSFGTMFEAGSEFGGFLDSTSTNGLTKMPPVSKQGDYGVSVEPFTGYNYISLFHGDNDAQPIKKLTQSDIAEFKSGIRDGAYLFLAKRTRVVKPKPKRSKRSSPTSIQGLR